MAAAKKSIPWRALWIVITLAGCASTPEATLERDSEAKRFTVNPNAATIYVYRADFLSAEYDNSVLYLNDRLIGATLPGTFFRIEARPGGHLLHGYGFDAGQMKIEVARGELHFVSLNVANGTSRFDRVEPGTGQRDILRCCALLENWAPGQRPLLR